MNDCIIHGDARDMREIEDATVHLIACSPPYNTGNPEMYDVHNDAMPFDAYLDMLAAVWRECYRVLVPGGRIAVNVANIGRQPYVALNWIIGQQLKELGFLTRGEIIWDKGGASERGSCAWGSWRRASNPTLRDVHEYIIVASKDTLSLKSNGGTTGITDREFMDYTLSVWHICPAGNQVGHPAPYPLELPRRLILLYTNRGDTVLDPFAGSGTTCRAAKNEGRHYIGYDISERYCATARLRLAQECAFQAMEATG